MNLPRAAERWLPELLAERARRRLRPPARPRRLHVAITDHYEPMGGGVTRAQGLARVAAWQERWPEIADRAPRDAEGRTPQYSFFYPQEEYEREVVEAIASVCRQGLGEVEVHIHHENETAAGFCAKMTTFLRQLHEEHGLLHVRDGRLVFGFIHGNWALDNSRPDGRWCGLTGEAQLLRGLGCYADFTMPSAPSRTQGGPVNRIFWSPSLGPGEAARPKAFARGVPARAGAGREGELLLIPGPLGVRRGRRAFVPRLEMGELAAYDPPRPERIPLWLALAPQLGEDVFLKLYSHGAREDNARALLGSATEPGLLPTLAALDATADEHGMELHWATAYGMFEAVERILSPGRALVPENAEGVAGARPVPGRSGVALGAAPGMDLGMTSGVASGLALGMAPGVASGLAPGLAPGAAMGISAVASGTAGR